MELRSSPGRAFGRAAIAVAIAAACAVAGASWLRARDAAEHAVALARELAPLREQLAAEVARRSALEEEISRLEGELAALRSVAPGEATAARPPEPVAPRAAELEAPPPDEDAGSLAARAEAAHRAAGVADAALPAFDVDRLVALGFRREDVERFRSRLDQIELDRLYLRDRATREGWLQSPRFVEESRGVDEQFSALRTEFDETLYDWALYMTGVPNRVAVAEVLEGSAAAQIGLERGDVIVRYDDRLVLNAGELRDATNAGRAGELVAIEIQRSGDTAPRRVFVPRGPMGVRLAPTAIEPTPAG